MEKGSNGDGDESGGTSPSRQGAEVTSPGSPDLETVAAAVLRGVREKEIDIRGFHPEGYILAEGAPRGAIGQA